GGMTLGGRRVVGDGPGGVHAAEDADHAEGPERAAHLEVAELRRAADAGDVALAPEVADDEELLGSQRHLLQALLVVWGADVAGAGAADAALDPAPGLDPPDALHDHVGRAQPQRDAFRLGIQAFLQLIEALRPLEHAVDDLLRVVDHDLHEVLGI